MALNVRGCVCTSLRSRSGIAYTSVDVIAYFCKLGFGRTLE